MASYFLPQYSRPLLLVRHPGYLCDVAFSKEEVGGVVVEGTTTLEGPWR